MPAMRLLPWLLCASWIGCDAQAVVPQTLTVEVDAAVGPLPSVGYGWEMWQMFQYIPHMGEKAFVAAVSNLAPAVVRVGGITADWTVYNLSGNASARGDDVRAGGNKASRAPFGGFWPDAPISFTAAHFETLFKFFESTGLQLIFDLNELFGRTCNATVPVPYNPGQWCTGSWDMSNVRAFLQYVHDNGLFGKTLIAFELGNELVSHLDPAVNVADIVALASLIHEIWSDTPAAQRPGLYAPSTDSCQVPAQLAIMQNITNIPGVLGYSFHAYPGSSGTGANALPSILLNATWLRTRLMTASSADLCLGAWNAGPRAAGLQLLLTESSSSWSTDIPSPAQNSFLNGFFTLAQLGQYSTTGVALVARWALAEASPFATVGWNGTTNAWDAAADLFVLKTFQQTVGASALNTSDGGGPALVYAACGQARNGSLTVWAVNPSNGTTVKLTVSSLSSAAGPTGGKGGIVNNIATLPRFEYVFEAPGGDVASFTPTLNGGAPLRLNTDGTLAPIAGRYVSADAGDATITLPPLSQSFFRCIDAQVPACM
jgi:hypothetical protein